MSDNTVYSGQTAVEQPKEDNSKYILHSETVAQEAAVAQEPKEEVKTESEESSEQAPRKKGGFQRKIDNLSARNAELERMLQEATKGKVEQPSQTAKTPDPDKEPSEADYDNVLDYVKAVGKWELKQEFKQRDEAQSKAAEEAEYQKNSASFEERAEEFMESVPDFTEKLQQIMDSGLVTPEIERAVLKSDMSERVAYHLSQYPADLMIMKSLDKTALNAAITQIENFIENQPKEVAAVRQTQAAAPITPVKTSASTSRSLDELSFEDYKKQRNKELKGR